MRWIIALVTLLLSSGCTFNGLARMYPANPEAKALGAFTIEYKDVGKVGVVDFITPDGEAFQGSYTTIDDSVSASQWGSVFAVLDGSTLFAAAPQTTTVGRASLRGALDAFGSRGTTVQCEYLVNRASRSGTGACMTSAGALYRMHFSVCHRARCRRRAR